MAPRKPAAPKPDLSKAAADYLGEKRAAVAKRTTQAAASELITRGAKRAAAAKRTTQAAASELITRGAKPVAAKPRVRKPATPKPAGVQPPVYTGPRTVPGIKTPPPVPRGGVPNVSMYGGMSGPDPVLTQKPPKSPSPAPKPTGKKMPMPKPPSSAKIPKPPMEYTGKAAKVAKVVTAGSRFLRPIPVIGTAVTAAVAATAATNWLVAKAVRDVGPKTPEQMAVKSPAAARSYVSGAQKRAKSQGKKTTDIPKDIYRMSTGRVKSTYGGMSGKIVYGATPKKAGPKKAKAAPKAPSQKTYPSTKMSDYNAAPKGGGGKFLRNAYYMNRLQEIGRFSAYQAPTKEKYDAAVSTFKKSHKWARKAKTDTQKKNLDTAVRYLKNLEHKRYF